MIYSYKIRNFEYRTPVPFVNENGEACVTYLDEPPSKIPQITFLFSINENDEQSDSGINMLAVANNYLMHLVVNKGHKCVSTQSRALIQYFSFLEDIGMQWDEMPARQNNRPTYRFKSYLEDMVKTKDSSKKLRVSTSKSYMRSVVNFYKFYLSKGYKFNHEPFEFEFVSVDISNNHSSMESQRRIEIQTTDLRLKISEQKQDIPNKLQSLTKAEWEQVDEVIRLSRKVMRVVDGVKVEYPLAIEFSLIFLLMRYCGLRREEALSFTLESVFNPSEEQMNKGYVKIPVGLSVGIKTKNSKERPIEIPSMLMRQLFRYSNSNRYLGRKRKLEHSDGFTPLFINNSGDRYSTDTLNARWSEVRSKIREIYPEFNHKSHNLRPTYAVDRIKQLINSGIDQSDALTYIQNRMGHSDLKTTFYYLKQINEEKSADELAEIVYNFIFDDDMDI